MKKILVVNTVPFVKGGISSVIINYYENMDLTLFRMNFVVNEEIDIDYKLFMDEKGAEIFIMNRNSNPIKYIFSLYQILKKEKYDVVHIHGNSATMLVDILPAVMANVKNRIVHCHNTKCNHSVISKILNILFKRINKKALACSKAAGDWLFDEGNFEVLPNGIDTEKYRFSEQTRAKVRDELGIKDKYVVGHVGFMNEQKNHEKLLSIFFELRKKKSNAHLLCVTGSPDIPPHIKKLIKKYGIEKSITVLFQRTDVNRLLQAMDIFVLPSKWEGLPVSGVEAQITGLPCVVSDKVAKEMDFGDIRWQSIEDESQVWADTIMNIKQDIEDRKTYYEQHFSVIKKYQISENVQMLENLYLNV